MHFRIMKGLPPYDPLAQSFPTEFGRTGQEGLVVEFESKEQGTWTANFKPGFGTYSGVHRLPESDSLLVVSQGHAYFFDPQLRMVLLDKDEEWVINGLWEVSRPQGFVLNQFGNSFLRWSPERVLWHTHSIAIEGFVNVEITESHIRGLASMPGGWVPFEVDLTTGTCQGGLEDPTWMKSES